MPPETADVLAERIRAREALVGVAGLGYVGLPIAAAMVDAGFRVLGLDVDDERVARLARGEAVLAHLSDAVASMAVSGRFEATTDASRMGEPDVWLVCVPTPLTADRKPDLTAVEQTVGALARTLRRGQLVVLESTTWPGTTRDVLLPRLQASGLVVGQDVFLAYSPEREDPGRRDVTTRAIPRLVGGVDEASRDVAVELYRCAVDHVVPVSSAEVAESAKLLENVYRAVNIALVNEAKTLFTTLGIDVWEVLDAAATKPFGFQAFRPGPGLGGHCIPIDPFYLAWRAEQAGLVARLVAVAGEINHAMPGWVVDRTAAALEERGGALEGARILVLGVAYKPDIDDIRESPSFALLAGFVARGAEVEYHDPHVPRTREIWHPGLPAMESVPLDDERLGSADAVVIATDHSIFDYARIGRLARLVVDTRGAMRDIGGDHVVIA